YELMLNKLNTYLKYLRIKQIPLEYTLHGSTWFNGRYDDELDMTPAKTRFNQQAKPVRRATNWDKIQQQQSQTVPQMTQEERNAIFREYGR
ncbi:MAG: helix-turn-helix domain-containing protein, partial [Limosilactobacillus fermentum]|nr:helix-turn-helix domain-containing protein [Limosilactobacillus fermentum]